MSRAIEHDLVTVSPKLTVLLLIEATLGWAVIIVPGVVLGIIFGHWWIWALTGAAVLGLLVNALIVPRQVRAIGYSERESDLVVVHGILVRRITVVPYGRLQFVDVVSGPLERMFGLAKVQLHTASPASDAKIPGLPAAEADRLRDALARRGESELAGL